jgi:hypothetical protein
MNTAMYFDGFVAMATTFEELPATPRGPFRISQMFAASRQTISSDAIGTFALTLTNLVVGSAIQIEDQLGTTTLYNGTAASTSELINLSAYAGGSSLNDLRIKVRKGTSGSSIAYQPYETLATAIVGSGSIYVSQIPDE